MFFFSPSSFLFQYEIYITLFCSLDFNMISELGFKNFLPYLSLLLLAFLIHSVNIGFRDQPPLYLLESWRQVCSMFVICVWHLGWCVWIRVFTGQFGLSLCPTQTRPNHFMWGRTELIIECKGTSNWVGLGFIGWQLGVGFVRFMVGGVDFAKSSWDFIGSGQICRDFFICSQIY